MYLILVGHSVAFMNYGVSDDGRAGEDSKSVCSFGRSRRLAPTGVPGRCVRPYTLLRNRGDLAPFISDSPRLCETSTYTLHTRTVTAGSHLLRYRTEWLPNDMISYSDQNPRATLSKSSISPRTFLAGTQCVQANLAHVHLFPQSRILDVCGVPFRWTMSP